MQLSRCKVFKIVVRSDSNYRDFQYPFFFSVTDQYPFFLNPVIHAQRFRRSRLALSGASVHVSFVLAVTLQVTVSGDGAQGGRPRASAAASPLSCIRPGARGSATRSVETD